MRVAVFSAKAYDRRFLDAANLVFGHELDYFDARLGATTTLASLSEIEAGAQATHRVTLSAIKGG